MPGRYPDVNELMVRLYYSDGQTEGFYYDFRDLDGNGTAEMLVAYGEQTKRICGVYGGGRGRRPAGSLMSIHRGKNRSCIPTPTGPC